MQELHPDSYDLMASGLKSNAGQWPLKWVLLAIWVDIYFLDNLVLSWMSTCTPADHHWPLSWTTVWHRVTFNDFTCYAGVALTTGYPQYYWSAGVRCWHGFTYNRHSILNDIGTLYIYRSKDSSGNNFWMYITGMQAIHVCTLDHAAMHILYFRPLDHPDLLLLANRCCRPCD